AQRVGLQPALRFIADRVDPSREEVAQRRAVTRLALGVAEAVEMERELPQPAAAVEVELEQDALGVLFRRRDAEGLDAELVVLPVAPRLGALVAQHRRGEVIELRGRARL